MDIKEKLIEIIISSLVDDKERARDYLRDNNDVSKLAIDSIQYMKIIVDIELNFQIEVHEELFQMNYFSFLDILYEYVYESIYCPNSENKVIAKVIYMEKIKNDIYDLVCNWCPNEDKENLKITGDISKLEFVDTTLSDIHNKIKTIYNVDFNENEINKYELNNLKNMSKYIYEKANNI